MIGATKASAAKPAAAPEASVSSDPKGPLPFDWPLANEAEQLLRRHVDNFLERNTFARRLAERMRDETGTDFFESIDHLVLAPGEEQALRGVGFRPDPDAETPNREPVFEHPRGYPAARSDTTLAGSHCPQTGVPGGLHSHP